MQPESVVIRQTVSDSQRDNARRLRREMTPEERLLWERVRGRRLSGLKFRRQQIVRGFYADFYCHAAALVVEIDGTQHTAQAEYDAERSQVFGRAGIVVIRFTNAEVRSRIDAVLEQIAAACAGRLEQSNTNWEVDAP